MNDPEKPQSETRETIPATIDHPTLLRLMRQAHLPIDAYGHNQAKTIDQLLGEINEGETVLEVDPTQRLYRTVRVLGADVLFLAGDGSIHLLHEDRQELSDGRIRRRTLNTSIGEKMKPDETPQQAALRGIHEELGINQLTSLHEVGYHQETFFPPTFPGLRSTYRTHLFATVIPPVMYRPEGYVEVQPDKTNYYLWHTVRESSPPRPDDVLPLA